MRRVASLAEITTVEAPSEHWLIGHIDASEFGASAHRWIGTTVVAS